MGGSRSSVDHADLQRVCRVPTRLVLRRIRRAHVHEVALRAAHFADVIIREPSLEPHLLERSVAVRTKAMPNLCSKCATVCAGVGLVALLLQR